MWRLPLAVVLMAAACHPGARSPFAIPDSLRLAGHAAQVVDRYRALRDSFAQLGERDTASWWHAQLYYGASLLELGHRDSARAAFARALALAGTNPHRLGWTHFQQSILLDREGQFDSALAEAQQTQALARAARERPLEGSAYNAYGRIYSLTGRHRLALAAHDSELAIERKLGADPREVAIALNERAIDLLHLGRYSDAAQAYHDALLIDRRLKNPLQVAIVLLNYANVYSATGDDDRALGYLQESMALADSLENPRGEAITRNNLAELYARAGQWGAAERLYGEALTISRAAGLSYGIAVALDNLGRAALAEGRSTAAIDSLRRGLAVADAKGYGTERAMIRAGLARAYAARGDGQAAQSWAAAALVLADSLDDPAVRYEALAAQSAAARAAHRPRAAIVGPALEAITLLESVRGRLALGDLRMGITEPRTEAYETAIGALVADHRAAEAFAVAERARARLLLDVLATRDATRPLQSREDTLRQALSDRYDELADVPAAQRAAVDGEITRLTTALAAAEDSARRLQPGGAVHHPAPATVGAVTTTLVGADRALLEYFWGDSAVYGWWIDDRGMRAARLGRADTLAALVQFLRSAAEHPEPGLDWRPAARRAYRQLVAPLAPSGARGARSVYVVPDGPLAYLPLEVLVDSAGPWGATRQLVYGPSAGVLVALATGGGRGHGATASRAMLAVGDPAGFAPLPYAAQEAESVTALFRTEGADLLVGPRATVTRWLGLDPGRYRYLHFASHAHIDDRRPDRTSLELAGEALTLPAIRRLALNARLVTLSGCETALGRRVRGEGVVGLPHAFLAAGARGAVVTLWRVGDRSAADFTEAFYQSLQAGQSPAAALTAVRRAWLAGNGARSHPSQWAPFILIGAIEPREAMASHPTASLPR